MTSFHGSRAGEEYVSNERNSHLTVWDCHPECPVAVLDVQSSDSGGASRYFTQTEWNPDLDGPSFHYVAKPAKKERNLGLDLCKCDQPATTTSVTCDNCGNVKSGHPTVKPVALMRHLVRLVTPPGGTVLDPFTGSGTTGMAAMLEGCNFVGIEQSADYAENLARPRIEQARRMAQGPPPASPRSPSQPPSPTPGPDQPSLFDN